MKTSFLALALISLSATAHAKTTPVQIQKDGNAIQIQLNGAPAEALFDALDVPGEGQFGLVQTFTKKTENVVCVRGILGDVPGQMSGPRYHCTITESAR